MNTNLKAPLASEPRAQGDSASEPRPQGHSDIRDRLAVTVDCTVFALDHDELRILLIRRALEPFLGSWALPGGFVRVGETLDQAARRELEEETGLGEIFLEQLYTFGAVDRDPRERVVTVAYFALVVFGEQHVSAATDAADTAWFTVDDLPELAFDHRDIVRMALERLRGKVRYQPIGFELLPRKFVLSELQNLYEVLLEQPLDKRNFRKKVLSMGILDALDEVQKDVSHRAARLYQFNRSRYLEAVQQGLEFRL